jgi:hypothetical protein
MENKNYRQSESWCGPVRKKEEKGEKKERGNLALPRMKLIYIYIYLYPYASKHIHIIYAYRQANFVGVKLDTREEGREAHFGSLVNAEGGCNQRGN